MTMPGQPTPSRDHGMPGMEQGGKSGMPHGKDTSAGPMGGQKGMMGQGTVAERLSANQKLSTKVGELLPAGTKISDAAAGFKSLGEFVAAAHVSQNLGIPFSDLKAKMTAGRSLGEAIHELRPGVDHKTAAKKAKEQANKTLRDSGH